MPGPGPTLAGSAMGGLNPNPGGSTMSPPPGKMVSRDAPTPPDRRRKLVEQWADDVRRAKKHWGPACDRMRWNMSFVSGDQWALQPGQRRRRRRRAIDAERIDRDDRYVANIALRHVLQRTAELYPSNPTVKAKRRQRIMASTW